MDFSIINHGSISLIMPRSEAAKEHCKEAFSDDTQTWGRSYVVEWRFVDDIIEDLRARGFELEGIKP